MPLRLAVRDIALFERAVRFARPFRFGAVVVEAAPQVFVRAEIEIEGKGRSVGASAEMMVPKWFDKRRFRHGVRSSCFAYCDAD